jgi:NAD(P)-dependent dehydrogenase (short-subunit alcohol dehydrogenase family)
MAIKSFGLEGKCAIVSGGASGIGFATAQRLLESGAKVSLWDIQAAALDSARSRLQSLGAVDVRAVDVTNLAALKSAAAQVKDALGSVDILVNSAGISGPSIKLVDYPEATWRQVIDIDLTGTFFCCQAVLPYMIERNWGRIVNVASVAGKEGNPMVCAYSAAKAGVIGLTKSLGKELANTDIRVNCITPATVNTEILKQLTQQQIDYMVSRIPIGRMGTVEENANMIAWMCTEECSFTTGAVFDTSGGRCTY